MVTEERYAGQYVTTSVPLEDAISKAEKKLESLKREKAELERKIEVNERTQLDTENEIKAKQEGLEILKSKRITTPVSPGSGSVQKTNP